MKGKPGRRSSGAGTEAAPVKPGRSRASNVASSVSSKGKGKPGKAAASKSKASPAKAQDAKPQRRMGRSAGV